MPAKLKMSKPEYIYIDADKMAVHKDGEKQVKVIAGKFEKLRVLLKDIMLNQFILILNLIKIKNLILNYLLLTTHSFI